MGVFNPAYLSQLSDTATLFLRILKGEKMAIIADENTSVNVSEIKNAQGEVIARFTREYFAPATVKEVAAVESILLKAAVEAAG